MCRSFVDYRRFHRNLISQSWNKISIFKRRSWRFPALLKLQAICSVVRCYFVGKLEENLLGLGFDRWWWKLFTAQRELIFSIFLLSFSYQVYCFIFCNRSREMKSKIGRMLSWWVTSWPETAIDMRNWSREQRAVHELWVCCIIKSLKMVTRNR